MNAPVSFDHHTHAATAPLDQIDVSDPQLYFDDVWYPYFERLRRDDPVHYVSDSPYGPYWAISRFKDIIHLEVNHKAFSSSWDLGGIRIEDIPSGYERPSFILLDPPDHDQQRLVVSPTVAPLNLAKMETLIRERTGQVLEALPHNEEFNWVDRVSIELTSMMLCTLFDYPVEDRRQLVYWSEVVITDINAPGALVKSEAERFAIQLEYTEHLNKMWEERAKLPPSFDIISILAHSDVMNRMSLRERMGILTLFLVGGNDTTRNSMSGGLWGLSQFPDQMRKLRANPALVTDTVPEIIRWQTPVIHMRRTALQDVEFGGKVIRKGDKVVVWYISGNRDDTVIERPNEFIVDRRRPREHLSFGFGIHRCLGNRLAELQLKILWEEVIRRNLEIEVLGKPVYAYSNFLRGIKSLPVRLVN